MAKKIVLGLGILFLGLCGYVATKSDQFLVTRELVVNAPAEKIFPYLNNSQKADSWMPWAESDPSVTMTYSGPDEGVGSRSSWDGQGNMGAGEAVVVESVPNQTVKTKLTYTRPMEMDQMAELSLHPTSDGTTVRWTVSGKNTFVGRFLAVFVDMEKMVGGEFEKGLTKLKTMVESAP